MLVRLPLDISQAVVTQWLPLIAIVRLDTGCSGAANRHDWLKVFKDCTIQVAFIAPSRSALAAINWVSSRQMKFFHYVIHVTKRNKAQRIARLSAIQDSIVRLSIQDAHDPVQVANVVIDPSNKWKLLPWFGMVLSGNTVEPQGIKYEQPAEDTDAKFPALVLPKLTVLSVECNNFDNLEWLLIAPELTRLLVEGTTVNSATFEAIATRFPKLQHLAISLTHYLKEATVLKMANQLCGKLRSLKAADHFMKASPFGYAHHLLPHCGHLQYLALYGFPNDDRVCEQISTHCPQLLGLDLGGGHRVTQDGLHSLAAHCTTLRSLGLSFSRWFEPSIKDALDALILANAATLQRFALAVGSSAAIRAAQFDLCLTPSECPHLRSLHIGFLTVDHAAGILHLLDRCEHMQKLYLPWLATEEMAAWQLHLMEQIAAQYPHVAVQCTPQRELPIWAADAGFT